MQRLLGLVGALGLGLALSGTAEARKPKNDQGNPSSKPAQTTFPQTTNKPAQTTTQQTNIKPAQTTFPKKNGGEILQTVPGLKDVLGKKIADKINLNVPGTTGVDKIKANLGGKKLAGLGGKPKAPSKAVLDAQAAQAAAEKAYVDAQNAASVVRGKYGGAPAAVVAAANELKAAESAHSQNFKKFSEINARKVTATYSAVQKAKDLKVAGLASEETYKVVNAALVKDAEAKVDLANSVVLQNKSQADVAAATFARDKANADLAAAKAADVKVADTKTGPPGRGPGSPFPGGQFPPGPFQPPVVISPAPVVVTSPVIVAGPVQPAGQPVLIPAVLAPSSASPSSTAPSSTEPVGIIQPVADSVPQADSEPPTDGVPQEQRYLQIRNGGDKPVRIWFQYSTRNDEGKWAWYPENAAVSGKGLAFDVAAGQTTFLGHRGAKLSASRIRYWFAPADGELTQYHDVWLVSEVNKQGKHLYFAKEMEIFPLELPR